MIKIWDKSYDNYTPSEVCNQVETIPNNVFTLQFGRFGFYLTKIQDEFTFPYKVYGIETEFINRVEKTYQNTTGNLGILLTGVKGTGKTVTAEMICNRLNLPVIIVEQAYGAKGDNPLPPMNDFINGLNQDVVLFFDEYEKMYNNYDSGILTVMDGVMNGDSRKIFMLTTNSTYINENMLQRPGRVRYIKNFDDLDLTNILEILDDRLKHPEFKKETIEFISGLELITVDIVKSIIEEVNIHKESPFVFKDIFNITIGENCYNVFEFDKDNDLKLRFQKCQINIPKLEKII